MAKLAQSSEAASMPNKTLMVFLASIILRLGVSLHSYSGKASPPMYGDFEAQRHWMEVTYNLPTWEWYSNTSRNDLNYWGLDYPPLTAYHSYVAGAVAHYINPEFVAFEKSRGRESYELTLFMRISVIIVDVLLYILPCVWYWKSQYLFTRSKIDHWLSLAVTIMQPSLLLIDHGHFQYNCVSLGLFVLSVTCFLTDKLLIGSVAFVCALNYKQMELYHALPIFCFLLGTALKRPGFRSKLALLVKLGTFVVATFLVIWLPFLQNPQTLWQVVHRIFPLNRGVFEDYVANFWCFSHVAFKVKTYFSQAGLAQLCLLTTAIAALPACAHVLLQPSIRNLRFSLVNVALAFFLFSFHVHEKSILLVVIPVCLIFHQMPFPCFWFLLIANFSMLPLLIKDGLISCCIALSVLLYYGVHYSSDTVPLGKMITYVFYGSLSGCALITFVSLAITAPARYPYLWDCLVTLYSFAHFAMFFVYFNHLQIFVGRKIETKKAK